MCSFDRRQLVISFHKIRQSFVLQLLLSLLVFSLLVLVGLELLFLLVKQGFDEGGVSVPVEPPHHGQLLLALVVIFGGFGLGWFGLGSLLPLICRLVLQGLFLFPSIFLCFLQNEVFELFLPFPRFFSLLLHFPLLQKFFIF